MICALCGYEGNHVNVGGELDRFRWWDPDDGWRVTALCCSCAADATTARPQTSDYAWDHRNEYVASEEEYIDTMFGGLTASQDGAA